MAPKQLAQQMTLLESEMFFSVQIKEFYNKSWSRDSKYVEAPNITNLIELFNKVYATWYFFFKNQYLVSGEPLGGKYGFDAKDTWKKM